MEPLLFQYQASLVRDNKLTQLVQRLHSETELLSYARTKKYDTPYASINLPFDDQIVHEVKLLARQKKNLNPDLLLVIGIGGSNLGTLAIHQALSGLFYNQKNTFNVFFLETVDTLYVYDVLEYVENALRRGKRILINVVSKSGSTTETIALFDIFLNLLKKYHAENFNDYVVVTTEYQSKLWHYAQKNKMACLDVPKMVGGRFSVFSPVGLFPLAFLDVDIDHLLSGARDMVQRSISRDIQGNYAALSAALIYAQYRNGKNIYDTFLFSTRLEALGKWYRQLMGESIGKACNRQGQIVEVGITPTVSIGSTDLHSVGQLYLGGPRDKFTTFVTVSTVAHDLHVPTDKQLALLVEGIQGKTLHEIMSAIAHGVQKAYEQNKRPFCSIILPEISAYAIGQFMQLKMIEIMYLGYLLDVNPFDQPQVELYKQETRKILSHE